jgi:hypothetical protein
VNEEMRRERVPEVVELLRQAEVFGTPAMVSSRVEVGVMHTAVYGDDEGEEEALAEAFNRGAAGGPFIAELKELTKTNEGKAVLLEAYARWKESDE